MQVALHVRGMPKVMLPCGAVGRMLCAVCVETVALAAARGRQKREAGEGGVMSWFKSSADHAEAHVMCAGDARGCVTAAPLMSTVK